MSYTVGYIIGSLSSQSINRKLAQALIRVAPDDLEFSEIPIDDLPLYNRDLDKDFPAEATALKEAIAGSQAVLFVTPEHNRSIPGALANAIDWASRPYGKNSFDHVPVGVIGASPGGIGTAVAQQGLRGILSYCNARQMTAPEAYIQFVPDAWGEGGEVKDPELEKILTDYMQEFRDHVERVLTVLPRT